MKKIIPIKIIEELPQEINKEVFKAISKDLRLEYIVSLDESLRKDFVDGVTQEGTKGREVLDFEISKLAEDEVAVARIQRSDEIKKNYILEARSTINENEVIYAQVMDIVDDWLSNISNDDNSSKVDQEAA